MNDQPPPSPVLIIGAGLLGTSIGLALTRLGSEVHLADAESGQAKTASGLGAGRRVTGHESPEPSLVIVAVPPDHLGPVIAEALVTYPGAVVTDVGSVKAHPLDVVRHTVAEDDLARYVGGHPMAGSERSGPLAASAALFEGRPWAVTPHETSLPTAVAAVDSLARGCGAVVVSMTPDEHDRAVARMSHLPQLVSSLVAGRLAEAPAAHLALAGQGVRDVTRIAASDPALWQQIVAGNADAIGALLAEVRSDLDSLMAAVSAEDRSTMGTLLDRGVAGARAVPGKHGGPAVPLLSVYVSLPDHPGELARLFADVGAAGANIEDVHIDHDPGRPMGQVELVVGAEEAADLYDALESLGWTTHR